jgi:uncharacterized protein YjbI with pentapeptide repeats
VPLIRTLLWVALVGGILLFIYGVSEEVPTPLGIPPSVSLGALLAFLSNYILQKSRDRAQTEREQSLEIERQQDAALAAYTEKISELMIEKDLHERSKDPHARRVAQALTISILMRLDSLHKRRPLKFVYTLGLIEKDKPLLNLRNASLDHADLSELSLRKAHLRRVDLRVTDLTGADLRGSDLGLADLRGAYLRSANLRGVNLRCANLMPYDEADPARWSWHKLAELDDLSQEKLRSSDPTARPIVPISRDRYQRITVLREAVLESACLRNAYLAGADLREAQLDGADLTKTYLRDADLTGCRGISNEQLEKQASSLEGATMPNGQKYEDWLESKGSGEE